MHGWIIDQDYIDAGKSVGTIGPSNVHHSVTNRLLAGRGTPFRLYDDDGELYYEGRLYTDTNDGKAIFSPLDDFGAPNAGCTTLYLKPTDEWELA